MTIQNIISNELIFKDGIWLGPEGGYWSNINKSDQVNLLTDLGHMKAEEAMKKHFPEYFEVVFSPKRAAGLALLDITKDDVVLDAGCMWGALTIPAARTGATVIGIEQTYHSLALVRQRVKDEGLNNICLVCADLKKIQFTKNSVDKFIINGVLEWLPETETIELKKYYGKKSEHAKTYIEHPRNAQSNFLQKAYNSMKKGGKLYLAIENRYDILHFLGKPDPHCNVRFITFLPRRLQDYFSRLILNRPYTNWIYSRNELIKLVAEAGFSEINMHYAFPDYRFPEYIFTDNGMSNFYPFQYRLRSTRIKKLVGYIVEEVVYRRLKAKSMAPCFIVVAKKG